MPIASVNPFDNRVVKTFEEHTPDAIEHALARAQSTFEAWRTTKLTDRAAVLTKVAAMLRQRTPQLAALLTMEMGKLIAESKGELALAADIFDYYASKAPHFLADKPLDPSHGKAFVRHCPLGVVLGVEPWNFSFYQVARFAAPNIMIGNTVLVKHASNVPQCAIAIEDIFRDVGAPLGLYTNLLISGSHISALLDDPRIKGAALTGSEDAGASLAAAAGKNLKKSVLELGGSDAFIVLEDADIDQAVHWAFIGRMNNTGQCCIASKRFIVLDAVANEFTTKLIAKMSNLKVGDPLDHKTQLGPLSSEAAVDHLDKQVQRAIKAGAKVQLGGRRITHEGAFFEATVLTDLPAGSPSSYEEMFGPVAIIYRVANEAAAIALANDPPSAWAAASSAKTSLAPPTLPTNSIQAWSSSTTRHGPPPNSPSAA